MRSNEANQVTWHEGQRFMSLDLAISASISKSSSLSFLSYGQRKTAGEIVVAVGVRMEQGAITKGHRR